MGFFSIKFWRNYVKKNFLVLGLGLAMLSSSTFAHNLQIDQLLPAVKVSDYGERDAGVCCCRRAAGKGKPLEAYRGHRRAERQQL